MENQHRKIEGYRELSQQEIDLMDRIKTKGAELLALQAELTDKLAIQAEQKRLNRYRQDGSYKGDTSNESAEMDRFMAAEPLRWADIGKTDIQTGIMALVRAVAQPGGV